jgi:cytochrome c oxidase subunit II
MNRRKLAFCAAALVFGLAMFVAGSLLLAQLKDQGERVVQIKVKRFEYTPKEITIRKGIPVVVELTSMDVAHGFNLPDLGIRADVLPGLTTRVRIVPQQTGRFVFHCDIFCGTGHEELEGAIVVKE